MGSLDGKAVLVTGGGTGIGRACAARLAADGAQVTICGRTEARLTEAAASIPGARYIVADVTVEEDVARAVEAASSADGHLYGVMANAGGASQIAPYHRQDVEAYMYVLRLNVLGTMLCVKHAVPRMVAGGGGSFVGMSSIAGHVTHPNFGGYPVAKAAIESIMRNAADEYGAAGVRFNAVQPGFTTTELMGIVPRDSAVYDSYIRNTPMGGVAAPEDVASVVSFLMGPDSRWVTGQMIAVDGGHHLRAGPDFSSFLGLTEDQLLARSE
jgi:NAD(P)-dependent dehydrogenase (short-subunit alcohol dehydrogenase family)